MVNEVVADLIPTERPITPGVNGSDVAGLQRDVMNLVELDLMVISTEQNGAVRMLVDQVVRHANSHTAEEDGRNIALRPTPLASEVAVLDHMLTRRQRLPVTARDDHAPISGIQHIA